MDKSTEKKNQQLGMLYSKATRVLKKQVLFHILQRHNENICYQCGQVIETVDDLTVEHKVPWLDNSVDLFWDINNIAFSHLSCNCAAARHTTKKVSPDPDKTWCAGHKEFLPITQFGNLTASHNGKREYCYECRAKQKRRYYRNKKGI